MHQVNILLSNNTLVVSFACHTVIPVNIEPTSRCIRLIYFQGNRVPFVFHIITKTKCNSGCMGLIFFCTLTSHTIENFQEGPKAEIKQAKFCEVVKIKKIYFVFSYDKRMMRNFPLNNLTRKRRKGYYFLPLCFIKIINQQYVYRKKRHTLSLLRQNLLFPIETLAEE